MDNTDMNHTPPAPESPAKKKEGGFGSMAAIIVIILLLIAGGVYYFTVGVDKVETPANGESVNDDVAALNEQGTSDELADIEADLNATDLSGLDNAASGIDAELQ